MINLGVNIPITVSIRGSLGIAFLLLSFWNHAVLFFFAQVFDLCLAATQLSCTKR